MSDIYIPQPRSKLDTVAKALGIAQSVYGIKSAMEQSELHDLQVQDYERKKKDYERASGFEKHGIYTTKEVNKDFTKVDPAKLPSISEKIGMPINTLKIRVQNDQSPNQFDEIDVITNDQYKEIMKRMTDIDQVNAKKKETDKETFKAIKDQRDRFVPGLGTAYTIPDAKMLKNMQVDIDEMNQKVDEIINLRKTKGAEKWDTDSVKKAQQLAADLKLKYKGVDWAGLGVLAGPDMEILETIIPGNPLEWNLNTVTFGLFKDSTLSKLEEFKSQINNRYNNAIRTRIETPINSMSITENSGFKPKTQNEKTKKLQEYINN